MIKNTMIAMIAIAIIIAGGLGIKYLVAPINAKIERNVMVNSHQYIEGQSQQIKLFRANLEGVNAMLMTYPNNKDLLAQKRALTAQLRAAY